MKKALVLLLLVVFLVPSVSIGQAVKQATQRVSFDFIDADIRNVLRVLSELGTKNIVVAEDVKGKVTIKLENVPLEEAFDVILKNNDLARIEEENVTRIVTVKKLNDERDRETKQRLDFLKEKEAKDKAEEEFVTETVFVNYADVADVAKMIKGESRFNIPSRHEQPDPRGLSAAGCACNRYAHGRLERASHAERRRYSGSLEQRPHHPRQKRHRGCRRQAHKGT